MRADLIQGSVQAAVLSLSSMKKNLSHLCQSQSSLCQSQSYLYQSQSYLYQSQSYLYQSSQSQWLWWVATGNTIRKRSCQGNITRLAKCRDDRPSCTDELSSTGSEHNRLSRPVAQIIGGGRNISCEESGHRVGTAAGP